MTPEQDDPFYPEENQAVLRERIRRFESGEGGPGIYTTTEELDALAEMTGEEAQREIQRIEERSGYYRDEQGNLYFSGDVSRVEEAMKAGD